MALSSGTHARTCILLRMCLSESAVPQSSVSGMVTVLSLIRNPLKLLRASDTAPDALSRTTTNASVCMMGRVTVMQCTCVYVNTIKSILLQQLYRIPNEWLVSYW